MKNEPRPSPPPQSNLTAQAGEADAPPASSLEEVRRRLQSYGYLNSRIERFYLGSLSRTASQFLNRGLLSFRVGVLVGTLAALLMTAGTLLFNTELLRHRFDLALLFLYFELFFVPLFSVLELALIYLVSFRLRRAGPRGLVLVGQAVSILAGLAFFAYFFFWGRTQYEYLRVLSGAHLVAMTIILLLSCIFAAQCVWLGFLVAFREHEFGRVAPNWRRYGLGVMVLLAGILVAAPFLMRGEGAEEAPGPVAVLTTPDRWIVLGIDGMSRELLQKMSAAGEIPALSALAAESFQAQLDVAQPVVPPVSWTTIATGVPPAEHGILQPEARRWGGLTSWMQMTPLELAMHAVLADAGFGQRQPVSGYMRKAKAFWEILSDSGVPSGVVDWWGSWPARNQRGWNISERYYYKRASGAPAQNETFPAELFSEFAAPRGATPSGPALDIFYMDIFRRQIAGSPVRVAALYLPGLDILNYDFFQRKAMDPFEYTGRYREHLRRLDESLREIRQQNPGSRILVILHQGRSLVNDHSAILIHTPGNRAQNSAVVFSETDVAPLLLHTTGFPIARSMSPALVLALDPSASVRTVAAFRKVEEVDAGHADEFNDLLVEQMKSLGYLQ